LLGSTTTTNKRGAVPTGDIVITALFYASVVPTITHYGDALKNKIIVDISNPFNATFDGLAHNEETSIAHEVAKVAPPCASVVKAFNTIFQNALENGHSTVFLAGDNTRGFGEGVGFGVVAAHDFDGVAGGYCEFADGAGHVAGADEGDASLFLGFRVGQRAVVPPSATSSRPLT
jgi:hypothetical protein